MTESRLNLRPGTSYPDIPLFQGWSEPSRIEADVYELESYGQVPADLDGRSTAPRTTGRSPRWPGTRSCSSTGMACLAPSGMNGIGHYDFEKGQFTVHALPAGDTAQEVEFVPAHPGAPEGVGYLLALVNRVSERHSDLLVFDAEDIGAGPLGGYKLPLRLSTIHGTWVPEHQLAL